MTTTKNPSAKVPTSLVTPETLGVDAFVTNGSSEPEIQEPTPAPAVPPPIAPRASGATLRSRLLVTILPAILTPLAIASATGFFVIQGRVTEQIITLLKDESVSSAEVSAEFIFDALDIPRLIGTNPEVLKTLEATDKIVAAKNLNEIPIDRLERDFASTKLIQPDLPLNQYFAQVVKTEGLAEMFMTNANGLNIAYSNPTSDFVQRDESWWQTAQKQGYSVEPPEYDDSAGQVMLAVSVVVQDPATGKLLGIMKTGVPFSNLRQQLRSYLTNELRGSQQVQIIDAVQKVTIATVTPGETGPIDPKELPQQYTVTGGDLLLNIAVTLQSLGKTANLKPEQVTEALAQSHNLTNIEVGILDTHTGPITTALFKLDNKTYGISTVPSSDWVAVASIDNQEISAAGRDLLIIFGVIALVLGSAAAGFLVILARQLSRPLSLLSDAAETVASGNLDIDAPSLGTVETQNLAGSFNNLVRQVKGLLDRQQRETRRVQLLAAISQVKEQPEMLVPLNTYLEAIRDDLAVDRVVVYRFNPDWSGYIAGEAVSPGWPTALGNQINDACIPLDLINAYTQGRVVPTANVMNAGFHPQHQDLMVQLQIKANLVVPIVIAGDLFGLLVAHHCGKVHEWGQSEIDFLRQEAEQLGIVMSSLALLEQQQLAAAEEQKRREEIEEEVTNLMERIEGAVDGDLTVRAQLMAGEVGIVADLFNAVIENLQSIAQQVRRSSGEVSSALGDNELSIRELAEKSIQEAEEIQGILSSVAQMSQSIQAVAENANQAATISNVAFTTVQAGNQAMDQAVGSILDLRSTVGETAKKMKRLGESAQKISQVVALIDEIALKTNLLSINASVEAARAGELGQGFTAVAEQVGALAEQSAAATKEIAQIVANIQTETQELVEAMEVSTTQVVDSTNQVETTKQRLTVVLQKSQEIDQLMQQISQATTSQTETAQTVTTLMQQITTSAKQRSASSRQVAQAMQDTAQVAQALQASVEQFKVE
jgi:methyl-accepting chemotaxis protein